MIDTGKRAVAAVHAGWRGTVAGIVARAIQKMQADFGTQAKDIQAALGPCIRECCYEVGARGCLSIQSIFPDDPPVSGKQHINLPEANRRHLVAAGVPAAHIFDCGLCTSCLVEHFFSYRREPQNPGRMVSAICRL